MFIVTDNTIQNEKTLNIGTERKATLVFSFSDVSFADTDTFILAYNDTTFQNYSFTNDGLLKFVRVPFDFLTAENTSIQLKIYKNEQLIMQDTITVIASGISADLTDYYNKQESNGLMNQLRMNEIENSSDSIALAFDPEYTIQKVNLTSNGTTLTINPCTGYTAVNGQIPTFELWLSANTAKTSISISNTIQVVNSDNMPDQISTDKIFVFVWRFVGNKQTLNYGYSFTKN